MNSYILAGSDAATRTLYMGKLATAQTELIHVYTEKSSLTIKQVQDLSGPLSTAPRLPRIVWIEEAGLLTIPAQNALLKMLEEPPEGTTFYLTCNTASALLPTIRSRCRVINLSTATKTADSATLTELKSIMALSPGDRLSAIVKRDRAESLLWLTQIESELSAKLRDPKLSPSGAQMLAKIAKLAQNAHLQLSSNCSVGLATQVFYLLLPHTHSPK